MTRALAALAGACAGALALPVAAAAHGVQGRAETPVPIEVFFYAAAAVVVVSFAGLAVGWSTPRLERVSWRRAPHALERLVLSPVTIRIARAVVLAATVFLIVAAAVGSTILNRNIAPLTIFVVWWVGLVPLSLLFGNVWREVNPWATVARVVGGRRGSAIRGYPPTWGLWPAALLIIAVAWLELVYPTAASPRLLAAIAIVYSIGTVAAMLRYGVDRWLDHGEVFTVYTGMMAGLSCVEVREADDGERRLGFRPPFVGVTRIGAQPGLAVYVAGLIGAVSFDGLTGTGFWAARDVAATERLIETGMDPFWAGIVVATIGLLVVTALVLGAFAGASWAAGTLAGLPRRERLAGRLAEAFAHTLVPIAVGYSVAHYFTLFVFQSQDLIRLISDPFGTGADWFGTADHAIDFNIVGPNAIWTVQVAAIVSAHVLGLILAHERALRLSGQPGSGVRSQYPMLALMVVLTVSGLWFLSEGMNPAT